MEGLAGRYEPDDLNRIGFRLYEHFRPEVPPNARGWGAKGVLDLGKIGLACSPALAAAPKPLGPTGRCGC